MHSVEYSLALYILTGLEPDSLDQGVGKGGAQQVNSTCGVLLQVPAVPHPIQLPAAAWGKQQITQVGELEAPGSWLGTGPTLAVTASEGMNHCMMICLFLSVTPAFKLRKIFKRKTRWGLRTHQYRLVSLTLETLVLRGLTEPSPSEQESAWALGGKAAEGEAGRKCESQATLLTAQDH